MASDATRQTRVAAARDTVRGMILSGKVAPGSRLILSEVARQIGTSVTPVREALRDLAATGLVDVDAHKVARVHTSTAAELAQTYELRSMLESRAMAEVAALPEEDRVVSCTIAAKLAAQMEGQLDVAVWTTLNRDFHACLAEPLQIAWPLLFSLVDSLRNRSLLPVVTALRAKPTLMKQANCDHHRLVSAIRIGDCDEAAQVTAQHLSMTLKTLLEHLDEAE